MAEKEKKPFYKRKLVWVIAIIVIIAIGASASQGGNQANETTKSTDGSTSTQQESKKTEEKPRLTLDDGWSVDTSNPYMTQVVGTVSNNSDKNIEGYIQITFSALDADGANVGDCLANANTVDANGKWKFEAHCTGDNIETVRFKELSGF